MDTIPASLALEPRIIDPAELPDVIGAERERELLHAVMAHPAEDITAALAATCTGDLVTLYGYLDPAYRRAAAEHAIAEQLRDIVRTRRTSLLPELADQIEALQ